MKCSMLKMRTWQMAQTFLSIITVIPESVKQISSSRVEKFEFEKNFPQHKSPFYNIYFAIGNFCKKKFFLNCNFSALDEGIILKCLGNTVNILIKICAKWQALILKSADVT